MKTLTLLMTTAITMAVLAVPNVAFARDSDHDGMPNKWEKRHHTGVHTKSAKKDPDSDELVNVAEFESSTDPRDVDSDDDCVRDANEDGDRDGVDNESEHQNGTDPDDSDSDNDGAEDGDEDVNDNGVDEADDDNDNGDHDCGDDDDQGEDEQGENEQDEDNDED